MSLLPFRLSRYGVDLQLDEENVKVLFRKAQLHPQEIVSDHSSCESQELLAKTYRSLKQFQQSIRY